MKSGICPKCHAASVYRRSGNPNQPEQVTLSGGFVSQTAPPDRYVCGSCGYVEFYIPAEKHLAVVRETWEPVGTAGGPADSVH